MTRKKVKLAYIVNDSARKATYKKRKKGLIKKVGELTTLCGIDACAIIYSPYESQPEVWPNHLGAQRVIAQFKRMPEMEQTKKMVNQETYTRQRVTKMAEMLKKQQKDNREQEITELMYQCLTGRGLHDLTMQDLQDLGWILDHKLKEIYRRSESLKKEVHDQRVVAPVSLPPPQQSHMMMMGPTHEMMSKGGVHGLSHQNLGLDLGITMGGSMQPQGPSHGMSLSMDATHVPKPQWFTEWLNNPNEHMNFGHERGGPSHGGDMMTPFNNNQNNSNWPGGFFS